LPSLLVGKAFVIDKACPELQIETDGCRHAKSSLVRLIGRIRGRIEGKVGQIQASSIPCPIGQFGTCLALPSGSIVFYLVGGFTDLL
jgi:hypothetical protein